MVAGITIGSLISFHAQAEEITQDLVDKCFANQGSLPAYKQLENKIAFRKATFEQLANQDRATDQEKLLIAELAKEIKICLDLDFDWQTRIRPEGGTLYATARKVLEERRDSVMSSLIDLYNQKISYGEYIKQRQAIHAKAARDMAAANAENDQVNAEIYAEEENIKAVERAQKHRMWGNIFEGMARGIQNSQPPKSITCTPNGFGGVRCQ